MLAALRHAPLAAQYQHGHPDPHSLDLFPDLLLTQLDPRGITPKHELFMRLIRNLIRNAFLLSCFQSPGLRFAAFVAR